MFRAIKIRLTIFNLLVIGTIFFIIALVIFFGSPNTSSEKLKQDMWLVAFEGNTTKGKSEMFQGSNHYKDYIYVRLNKEGNVVERSEGTSSDKIDLLVEKANQSSDFSGEINLDERSSYFYMKFFIDKELGSTIVFTNTTRKSGYALSFAARTAFVFGLMIILVLIGSMLISEKALVPIKNAWQRQMDFTADASHELRTPLAVIQTSLELIIGNPEETIASQKEWLENILVENKRMTKLVEDLLTLSRADAQQQALLLSHVKLDIVMKETLALFESVASSEDIIFIVDIERDIDFVGDKDRLKQLFIILIDNAIKYNHSKGRVSVQLRQKGKSVELVVRNTGDGIEEEHLKRVFQRFYRVDKSRSRNEGGSGLGLAIAKWIVDEHKGHISVHSELGRETSFIVKFNL